MSRDKILEFFYATHVKLFIEYLIRAACKILIDSERRKNTQASSDVGARQLVRF